MTTKVPVELSSTPGIVDGSNATAITIDSSERVGIGESSPDELLVIGGDVKIKSTNKLHFTNTSDQTSIHAPASNTIAISTNSSERMRITSAGKILMGTSSAVRGSERVSIDCPDNEDGIVVATPSAGLIIRKDSFSNGFLCLFETSGGSAVGSITSDGTNTTFSTSSDARLKDITGEARGLEVINKLNPVAYNWKESGKADEGLIAQEVMDIVPNAVIGSEEEMYQMDYSKLVTPLVKAVQELTAEVEELKTKLESK